MDKIKFIFDESNEEVIFAILGNVQHKEIDYLLVAEEDDLDKDDMTVYILKAINIDGDEVIYEIVDDDKELRSVTELFEEKLEDYELDNN